LLPTFAFDDPGAHWVQLVEPDCDWYLPEAHTTQAVDAMAPDVDEETPAVHAPVQAAEVKPDDEP